MIKEFVERFDANRGNLEKAFCEKHPESYGDIVEAVVKVLHDPDLYETPDPKRIREHDWGDYQGCLLYVIACTGYQPSQFWVVRVHYGSCSGCDTLQDIRDRGAYEGPPTDGQVREYMQLALNIVQCLQAVRGDAA